MRKDVDEALETLADPKVHEQSVNRVCKAADVVDRSKLTATKQIHRISMLYAGLNVKEIDQFYEHLGHTAEMNVADVLTSVRKEQVSSATLFLCQTVTTMKLWATTHCLVTTTS